MIQNATKYSPVRNAECGMRNSVQTPRRSPALFLPSPKARALNLREWFWRELKDGGFITRYLQREKARTPNAIRTVARLMDGFQQNNKSDFRRLATLPAKLYHRWKNEDEQFFDDDNNLRSLKRDNPDLPIYLGPRRLGATAFRKVYESKAQSLKPKVAPTSDVRPQTSDGSPP